MTSRTVLGLSPRDHIGGRWAVSWQAYAINAPVSAASVLAVIDLPTTAAEWAAAACVMLIGLAVIAVFFLLADLTFLRNRRRHPVPISVVVALGCAIGATRAVAVHESAAALGLAVGPDDLLLLRALWAGVLGGVMLPLGALLLSSVSCFRGERRRLLDERASVERHLMEQEGVVESLSHALVEDVRDEVRREIADLPSDQLGPAAASEAVRRTSHRLWDRPASPGTERGDVPSVLAATLLRQPPPAVVIPAVWAVAAVPTIVGNVGGVLALINIAFSCLAIWACLRPAAVLARDRQALLPWLSALGALGAAVMTGPVAFLLFDPRPLVDGVPMFVANLLWILLVTAVGIFASAALASGEEVLTTLADDISDDEVRARALDAETERIVREIAARLHGSVHSPVVARAALSAETGDDEQLRQRLLDSVGQLTLVDEMDDDATLADCLAGAVEPWLPLVDVNVLVDDPNGLPQPPARQLRAVARAVDEAVANAYRHGGSTRIEVRAELRADVILLTVIDDGRGTFSVAESGLGTRLFDAMSPGAWSLATDDKGRTCLTLPIAQGTPEGAGTAEGAGTLPH